MPSYRVVFTAIGSLPFDADDPESAVEVASELCAFGVPVGTDWNGSVEIMDIEDTTEPGARLRGEL